MKTPTLEPIQGKDAYYLGIDFGRDSHDDMVDAFAYAMYSLKHPKLKWYLRDFLAPPKIVETYREVGGANE